MKTPFHLFFIALITTASLKSQNSVAFTTGPTLSFFQYAEDTPGIDNKAGFSYSGGLAVEIKKDDLYAFVLNPSFIQKQEKLNFIILNSQGFSQGEGEIVQGFQFFQLPFLLRIYPQKNDQIYFNFGFYGSYLHRYYSKPISPQSENLKKVFFENDYYEDIDAGFVVGIGSKFDLGERFKLGIEGRYTHGVTDIDDNDLVFYDANDVVTGSRDFDLYIRTVELQFSLIYNFIKEDK